MALGRPATASDEAAVNELTRITWEEPDAKLAPWGPEDFQAWYVAEGDGGVILAAAIGVVEGDVSELWLVRARPGAARDSYAEAALDALTRAHIAQGASRQSHTARLRAVGGEWVIPLLTRLGFVEERRVGWLEGLEVVEMSRAIT